MADVTQKSLSFSIQGEFITNLAREKLYEEINFPYAMDLLLSCTVTDQLSEADRVANAIAILDGRKELKGTYPGNSYGLFDIPENERDPRLGIKALFERITERMKSQEITIATQSKKLNFLNENLADYRKRELDEEFEFIFEKTADGDRATIFGTNIESEKDRYAGHLPQSMSGEKNTNPKKPSSTDAMLESFIQRMSNTVDEPDYGWLFPDGTFYPVEWGEHQSWADNWLETHDKEYKDKQKQPNARIRLWNAGDYLSEKHGAVLIHSPWQGIGEITKHETVCLTKHQKEFMYDYYIKRGQHDRANALYNNQ